MEAAGAEMNVLPVMFQSLLFGSQATTQRTRKLLHIELAVDFHNTFGNAAQRCSTLYIVHSSALLQAKIKAETIHGSAAKCLNIQITTFFASLML